MLQCRTNSVDQSSDSFHMCDLSPLKIPGEPITTASGLLHIYLHASSQSLHRTITVIYTLSRGIHQPVSYKPPQQQNNARTEGTQMDGDGGVAALLLCSAVCSTPHKWRFNNSHRQFVHWLWSLCFKPPPTHSPVTCRTLLSNSEHRQSPSLKQ